MSDIEFLRFQQVNPAELLDIVNEDSLRTHLIEHPYFDLASLQSWMEEKIKLDGIKGCRVRVVSIDGVIAGWCGIQPDEKGFELAIVVSKTFWGFGISIFKILMNWAKELGHKEILFHLLESRPEYKALEKISTQVYKTEQLGRGFTTYHVPVNHLGTNHKLN